MRGGGAQPRDASRELEAVVEVLAGGFADDPFLSWIFADAPKRSEGLAGWFRHWLGVYGADARTFLIGAREAAALWVVPRPRELGDADHAGMIELVRAHNGERTSFVLEGMAPLASHPPRPYWYLNAIAVAPERRAGGYGSRLLAPMLARADAEGLPVYLESSNPRNLTFYRRHGFEAWGDAIRMPDDGPSVQPMWRPAA